jgi:hypothetical protein
MVHGRWLKWALPAAMAAAGAAMMVNFGCGIIAAPVAVPMAVAANSNYSIKGTVVDQSGAPLDDVQIHVNHSHVYWDAMDGTTTVDESKTVLANKKFDFGWLRGSHVALSFNKPGYNMQNIELTDDAYVQQTSMGSLWPKNKPVRVMLMRNDAPRVSLRQGSGTISYANYPRQNVIGLTGPTWAFQQGPEVGDLGAVPAGAMYVEMETQPLKTKGADREVDPLDIGMPAKVVVRISAPDGGFVPFVPEAGCSPMNQMREAPESGYAATLVIDARRLRVMREKGSAYILEGHEFFYFRVDGKYGKGAISWGNVTNQPECRLTFALRVQGDGTRNLGNWEQ